MLVPTIYYTCWQYMFTLSSCVWVCSGVEIFRGCTLCAFNWSHKKKLSDNVYLYLHAVKIMC